MEEAARIAEVKEKARIAAEKEAKRIAEEKEAARIAAEEEAKRITAVKEAKRIAEEKEAARITAKEEEEAARIAAEEKAKRIAEEEEARMAAELRSLEEEAARMAAEEEAARMAAEEEEARMAAELRNLEEEAVRAAAEKEAARVAAEEEANRIAAEEEAKRIAAEEEVLREEEAARIAAERNEAARIATELDYLEAEYEKVSTEIEGLMEEKEENESIKKLPKTSEDMNDAEGTIAGFEQDIDEDIKALERQIAESGQTLKRLEAEYVQVGKEMESTESPNRKPKDTNVYVKPNTAVGKFPEDDDLSESGRRAALGAVASAAGLYLLSIADTIKVGLTNVLQPPPQSPPPMPPPTPPPSSHLPDIDRTITASLEKVSQSRSASGFPKLPEFEDLLTMKKAGPKNAPIVAKENDRHVPRTLSAAKPVKKEVPFTSKKTNAETDISSEESASFLETKAFIKRLLPNALAAAAAGIVVGARIASRESDDVADALPAAGTKKGDDLRSKVTDVPEPTPSDSAPKASKSEDSRPEAVNIEIPYTADKIWATRPGKKTAETERESEGTSSASPTKSNLREYLDSLPTRQSKTPESTPGKRKTGRRGDGKGDDKPRQGTTRVLRGRLEGWTYDACTRGIIAISKDDPKVRDGVTVMTSPIVIGDSVRVADLLTEGQSIVTQTGEAYTLGTPAILPEFDKSY